MTKDARHVACPATTADPGLSFTILGAPISAHCSLKGPHDVHEVTLRWTYPPALGSESQGKDAEAGL